MESFTINALFRSIYRISTVTSNYIQGVLNQSVTYILLIVFTIFTWVSPFFAYFTFGGEFRLIAETIISFTLLGAIIFGVWFTANSIHHEIEDRTLLTLISKPLLRHEIIIGKLFGSMLTILFFVIFQIISFYLMLKFRDIKDTYTLERMTYLPSFHYAFLLVYLQACIISAFSLLLAPYFKPQINICFSASFLLLGNLNAPLQNILSSNSSYLKELFNLLFCFIPDFTIYNVGELITEKEVISKISQYTGHSILYSVMYLCLLLSLGIILFNRKEIT